MVKGKIGKDSLFLKQVKQELNEKQINIDDDILLEIYRTFISIIRKNLLKYHNIKIPNLGSLKIHFPKTNKRCIYDFKNDRQKEYKLKTKIKFIPSFFMKEQVINPLNKKLEENES